MSTLQNFQQKKPEIFRDIMLYLARSNAEPEDRSSISEEVLNMSEEGTSQFIRGFLDVIAQELEGNNKARDEYMSLVVPPLKEGGLPLSMMARSLAPMFAIIGAHLGPAHLAWLTQYAHEHTECLFSIWDA